MLKTVVWKEKKPSLKERLCLSPWSPKKGPGSGFGLDPCKTSIFSIEIASVFGALKSPDFSCSVLCSSLAWSCLEARSLALPSTMCPYGKANETSAFASRVAWNWLKHHWFQRLLVCCLMMLGKGASHTNTKHTGVDRVIVFLCSIICPLQA